MPLVDVIRDHVFAAERVRADDTTVPVLAKGKTRVGDMAQVQRNPTCAAARKFAHYRPGISL